MNHWPMMPNLRIFKCTLRHKTYTTRIAPLLVDWRYCSLSLFLTKILKFWNRKKIFWDIKPFDSLFVIQHLWIHSSVYLLHWLHRHTKCILAVVESSWKRSLDFLRSSLLYHADILINFIIGSLVTNFDDKKCRLCWWHHFCHQHRVKIHWGFLPKFYTTNFRKK